MTISKSLYALLVIAVFSLIGYTLTHRNRIPSSQTETSTRRSEPEATLSEAEALDETTGIDTNEIEQWSTTLSRNAFQEQFPDPRAELRKLGISTSDSSIRDILSDTDKQSEARYWSAVAFGQSKSNDARQILANILEHDEDRDVRQGAIVGLAYLGDSESISILEYTLSHDPDDAIRATVVSALYRNNSDIAREVLTKVVVDQSQSVNVRANALEILALTRTQTSANTMRVLLVDDEPELRARAAVALSRDHSDEALSHLVNSVLNDDLPLHVWGDVLLRLQELTGSRFTMVRPTDYGSNPEARSATNREIRIWWRSVDATK